MPDLTPNPTLAACLHWAPGLDVEACAESAMDRLDRRFLSGRISGPDYDAACAALDAWVRGQR